MDRRHLSAAGSFDSAPLSHAPDIGQHCRLLSSPSLKYGDGFAVIGFDYRRSIARQSGRRSVSVFGTETCT